MTKYGIVIDKSIKYNPNIFLNGKYVKILNEGVDFYSVVSEDGGTGNLDISCISIVREVPKEIRLKAFNWWD
jgi:hypothetical protein